MSRLKINLVTNFSASLVTAVLSVVFVPVYLKMIGVESYGLIGFFAVMQTMIAVLDLGLSTTLNRELAVMSVADDRRHEMSVLVSTTGIIYWLIGAFVCTCVLAGSSWFATNWLNVGSIGEHTAGQCLMIGAFSLFFAWPAGLYAGGLMGLQRHARLNVVLIICSILRYAGVIPVLHFVGRDVRVFFAWQLFVNAFQTLLYMLLLRFSIGRIDNARTFDIQVLKGKKGFAAGIGFVTILGIILTQTDKIILSKILTLEMFGYYALASSIAMALYRVINPVVSAVFPRFSELMARGEQAALISLYHSGSQFLAVLLFPVLAMVLFFSWDIMLAWTGDPAVADNTSVILKLLVAGSVLNGMASLPIALQWAAKWVSLHTAVSLIMVVLLLPLLFVLSLRYGAIGGASVWLILNMVFISVLPVLGHRRLMRGELKHFYTKDLLPPFLASLLVAVVAKYLIGQGQVAGIFLLAVVFAVVMLAGVFVADDIRARIMLKVKGLTLVRD